MIKYVATIAQRTPETSQYVTCARLRTKKRDKGIPYTWPQKWMTPRCKRLWGIQIRPFGTCSTNFVPKKFHFFKMPSIINHFFILQREKGGREQGHKIGKEFPRSKWNKVVWAHKEEPRSYSLYTQSSSPFAFHFLKWCLNGKLHRETPVGKINDRRAWRWSREKGAMRLHLKANDTKRLMTLWHSFCTICNLINWFVSRIFNLFTQPSIINNFFTPQREEEEQKMRNLILLKWVRLLVFLSAGSASRPADQGEPFLLLCLI